MRTTGRLRSQAAVQSAGFVYRSATGTRTLRLPNRDPIFYCSCQIGSGVTGKRTLRLAAKQRQRALFGRPSRPICTSSVFGGGSARSAVRPSVPLPVYLSVCLSVCPSVRPSHPALAQLLRKDVVARGGVFQHPAMAAGRGCCRALRHARRAESVQRVDARRVRRRAHRLQPDRRPCTEAGARRDTCPSVCLSDTRRLRSAGCLGFWVKGRHSWAGVISSAGPENRTAVDVAVPRASSMPQTLCATGRPGGLLRPARASARDAHESPGTCKGPTQSPT
jgi:hypothetical protein